MKLSTALEQLVNEPTPIRRIIREGIGRAGLGSFGFRYRMSALPKMPYAYIVLQAAQLAKRLGYDRISVVEFGVAGGAGLIWMERYAQKAEELFGIKIEVYGFDTGEGLPPPKDFRDLPYHWKPGFFHMDTDKLQSRLTKAKLILGNVESTVNSFFSEHDAAPIGAVSHDMDFYSSTVAGLRLFDADNAHLLPRVFCYFDDVIGGDVELYSDFTGERLAIQEFNDRHSDRKIADPYHLRGSRSIGQWQYHIWALHNFDHPKYNEFVSREDQQIPI